jgi:NaMN:DMB phosphoribosyltransferase
VMRMMVDVTVAGSVAAAAAAAAAAAGGGMCISAKIHDVVIITVQWQTARQRGRGGC